ncbi:hypothetical protein ACSXDQ_13055 [Clostridium perfringens]|uniref:hypothetical protein n=1 Tax=Clostridium perfringens TaxID=1502 RepID=UPI0013E3969C|nr:hypothetical protein [Clostridium perfringens]NGT11428.1 hypothetical protein [Clostridium perfringens]
MKKWENPELMILGVESTKQDSDPTGETLVFCSECGENHQPDRCILLPKPPHKPAEPGEGPYPLPTPTLPALS